MENQLWNLFRETGDPVGYLLYKTDAKQTPAGTVKGKQPKPKDQAPSPRS